MSALVPPKNSIELKDFHTWMGSEGICRTVAKPGADISIDSAVENTKAVTSLFVSRKFPLLIDSRNVKYISREARKHFSTNGRETAVNSMAIMVKSPLSRVIGNFFMGINKPPVPAKLFEDENDAIEWLKQYL